MTRDNVLDHHITAGDRGGNHKSASLDAVGNNAMIRPPTLPATGNPYSSRSGTPDHHSDFIEKVSQIDNFRLPGHIFDDGGSLRPSSGHHDIHGGSYCDQVKIDMAGLHIFALKHGLSIIHMPGTAKGLEPFEVLVNGAGPNFTSPGQSNPGLPKSSQHGPHQVI